MIYGNTCIAAIDTMERARTGDYGERIYRKPISRFIGFCECRGCPTEIYSDDEYYEVEACGDTKGDVKLVCKSCMNSLF